MEKMNLAMAAAAMAVSFCAAPALAADFPNRPITLVVGASPGGPTDLMARIIADGLKESLPQPVVVENRPGQGGQLATMLVSRAEPDGHTLLLTSGGLAALPVTGQGFTLDPAADFTPIAMLATATRILLANADAPFDDVAGLIDYARANPQKVNYGDMGGSNTLDMALLAKRAGITATSIPYAGSSAQVEAALASGEIHIALDTYAGASNFLEQGKTKALAVGSAGRFEKLPDVASISETIPGYETSMGWYAVIGPKGIPAEIVADLNARIRAVVESPENRKRIEGFGLVLATGAPEELGQQIVKDVALWVEAASAAGTKP
jgi:tripartite-type tricarboxylate transporter receptor subunit TctC